MCVLGGGGGGSNAPKYARSVQAFSDTHTHTQKKKKNRDRPPPQQQMLSWRETHKCNVVCVLCNLKEKSRIFKYAK